jgi:hypothetical protein
MTNWLVIAVTAELFGTHDNYSAVPTAFRQHKTKQSNADYLLDI